MAVTPASLRAAFTEFANVTTYPDALIQLWIDFAITQIDSARWDTAADMGVMLYVAHNLVLEARAVKDSAVGGIPGVATGMTSSKSVDRVSVSYDTQAIAEKNAGHWNATTYGLRYYRLVRMFGAGPIHVGADASPSNSGAAWAGPYNPLVY